MSGKFFLVSNILEWFNFSFRKAHGILSIREAETLFNILWAPLWKIHSSPELLQLALSLRDETNASWYDSLILAAALKTNCRVLYSEDFQHGFTLRGLTIQNPFL